MLKRLSEWLCSFSSDKYVHLLCCQYIAFIVTMIFRTVMDRWLSAAAGLLVAIAAAVVKEIIDDRFDWNDIKADAIGTLTGILMVIL